MRKILSELPAHGTADDEAEAIRVEVLTKGELLSLFLDKQLVLP
jgi:hypothetical protein